MDPDDGDTAGERSTSRSATHNSRTTHEKQDSGSGRFATNSPTRRRIQLCGSIAAFCAALVLPTGLLLGRAELVQIGTGKPFFGPLLEVDSHVPLYLVVVPPTVALATGWLALLAAANRGHDMARLSATGMGVLWISSTPFCLRLAGAVVPVAVSVLLTGATLWLLYADLPRVVVFFDALLLVGFAAVPFVCVLFADNGTLAGGAGFLMSFVVTTLAHQFARFRIASEPSIDPVDDRPPVLYLRPFETDRTTGWVYPQPRGSTEEMQIAEAFNRIGPLVAVGDPRENRPRLGAARFYAPEQDWQLRVADLMRRSEITILGAGTGEGIRWEFEQAVEILPPQRLLVLVQSNSQRYEHFRAAMQDLFPAGLPENAPRRLGTYGSTTAVIYFDADWTPQHVPLTGFSYNGSLELALVHGLRPVFDRNGYQWPGAVMYLPWRVRTIHRGGRIRWIGHVTGHAIRRVALLLLVAAAVWGLFLS